MKFISCIAAALLLFSPAALADDCDGDPGYVLTMPEEAPLGEDFFGSLMAPQPSLGILFESFGPGPTDTPFGTFCLDFPPVGMFVFPMLDGNASFVCGAPCNPELLGLKVYMQFVAFDITDLSNRGLSNMSCVTVVEGSCDGEGCTPGYWRQDQHYDSWPAPFTPDMMFSDVFDDAFPGRTLGMVVDDPGGSKLSQLGFHTVAALLNGASDDIDYDGLTAQNVIDMFNTVYPGTDEEYQALKNTFADLNDRFCPLN